MTQLWSENGLAVCSFICYKRNCLSIGYGMVSECNLFSFFRSVLCSVLMYDLKLPNSRQTLSPNRKAFVSKVLPQLTGLQELAREKEMGGSDVSTASAEEKEVKEETKDGSCESDDRKEAIKRLKTSG